MKKTVTIKLFWAAILLLFTTFASATEAVADDFFLTPESKLTAEDDATADDQFGFSVAVSGDNMAVGAPFDDGVGSSSGSVYVFQREGMLWTKEPLFLTAEDAAPFDQFGFSVAISSDTMAVGAPYKSDGLTYSGAVYLFNYKENTWVPNETQPKLTTSVPAAFENFGFAVTIDGDRLVVGAPGSDSVYVFERQPDGEWLSVDTPPSPDADTFGWAVAASNGRVVVGAPVAGLAFILDQGVWEQLPGQAPFFGCAVAIHGDTVAVGAPSSMHPFVPATGAGSVHLFKLQGTTWVEEDILELSYAGGFGSSVSSNGNILVVGAPFDEVRHPVSQAVVNDAGSAYVFGYKNGEWTVQTQLIAGDPDTPDAEPFMNDRFGWAVATDGSTVVTGATFLNDAQLPSNAGAAYGFVMTSDNNAPTAHAEFRPDDVQEGDLVTLDGSLSNDPDNDPLTYQWVQRMLDHEPQVELVLADPKTPTFLAPELNPECTTFTFDLTVTDDKGFSSAPYTVEVPVQPNNEIHSTLGSKNRRRWWRPSSLWHHYKFKGSKGESVTINMKADANGSHDGSRANLILRDRIWGVRFWKNGGNRVPNKITATLPAEGEYSVYVIKRSWFRRRGESFTGDYVLTAEGTCGKLLK
jgi:hypothetical protein